MTGVLTIPSLFFLTSLVETGLNKYRDKVRTKTGKVLSGMQAAMNELVEEQEFKDLVNTSTQITPPAGLPLLGPFKYADIKEASKHMWHIQSGPMHNEVGNLISVKYGHGKRNARHDVECIGFTFTLFTNRGYIHVPWEISAEKSLLDNDENEML